MKKTVVITGASSGIGAATAEQLLTEGYTVYACARRLDKMRPLQKNGAIILEMDVTREASLQNAVTTVIQESGRIDALINNAGYGSFGALEDVPLTEARNQFEVNVFGLARLTQLVLPQMRLQRSGRIVNVTSIGAKIYEPLGSWYHATKFAVEGMSDCLRMELKPFGIEVIMVEPGGIKTEWSAIAQQKVLAASGQTVYRNQAEERAALLAYADKHSSDSAVVARTISKALQAKRPKTRYATGRGATSFLALRWLAPDRCMDWFMNAMTKTLTRKTNG